MLFSEDDAPHLKAWMVKRIENTSDADADVLAEYVIALLKHDGDRAAVRDLCEKEIPDFLSEDPKLFLDDVFEAIDYKSFVPGAPPPPPRRGPATGAAATAATAAPAAAPAATGAVAAPAPNGASKKRGFHDRDDFDAPSGHGGNDRIIKQARRGGRDRDRDRHGQQQNRGPSFGLPQRPDFPPLDPQAMEAFMQFQAMGMPFTKFPPGGQPRRKGRCRDFDTKGFCSRGSTCPYDHGHESVFVPPTLGDDYDPSNPMAAMPPNFMSAFAGGFPPETGRQRGGGRRNRNSKKGGSRAPFSAEGPVYDRSRTTIVVESIPEDHFSEDAVRGFFSQFGKIQEVTMHPYKRLAVVKYDKWGSANAAYHSPKVIFDNRFVKVFWYREGGDATIPAPGAANGGGGGGHAGEAPAEQEQEPELDLEEFQRRQEEAQRQHQEREAKRAQLEQQRQDLERQQQELLARHREENERLQAKLSGQNGDSGGGGDAGEPASGADMLRAKLAALEQEAKMLGIDPEDDGSGSGTGAGGPGSYAGFPPRGGARGGYRGRGFAPRGRGGFRGGGSGSGSGNGSRHAAYAQYSIDNRPKKLAVTGVDFTAPEKDEVLRHFLLNLGEFESVESSPSATHVSFQDRKTAERFYHSLHNRELPGVDGRLELAWVSTPAAATSATTSSSSAAAAAAAASAGKKPGSAPQGNGGGDADADDDEEVAMDMEEGELRDEEGDDRNRHPYHGEERAVNMDYEVADDDAWGD